MPRLAVRDMGTCLKFAGGTDKVTAANIFTNFSTTAYTVAFWFHAPVNPSNVAGAQVGLWSTDNTSPATRCVLRNGQLQNRYIDADDDQTAASSVTINASQIWTFVVCTLDRSDKKPRIYLNGNAANSGNAISTLSNLNSSTLTLGAFAGGVGLVGKMDEVRVWRGVTLNATEITNLYYQTTVPQSSSLILEWLMNEGSGSSLVDSSGNGNTGTIVGATYSTDVAMKPRTAAATRYIVLDSWTGITGADGSAAAQVDMGDVLDIGTNDFSVAFRVKPVDTVIAGSKIIVCKTTSTADNTVGWYIGGSSSTAPFGTITAKVDDGTNHASKAGALPLKQKQWNTVVVTFNRSGNLSIYVNGVLDAIQSIAAVTGSLSNATTLRWLRDSAGNNKFGGAIDGGRIWIGKVLTATEVSNLTFKNIIPAGVSAEWLFNEGAGSTANDTSGNGNNGIISVATYFSEVAFKPRKPINQNLVQNGDFEYKPPFTAVGTTSVRWIDGTAAGSITNDNFMWAQIIDAAACSVSFDTSVTHGGVASLKIDCTNATGRGRACQGAGTASTGASLSVISLNQYALKLVPSTSYTFSYWLKATNSQGSCGVNLHLYDPTGTRSSNTGLGTTGTAGTFDWVQKTGTFTTAATDVWGVLSCGINTAGAAQTVWIDDIVIKPTTATVRTAVT